MESTSAATRTQINALPATVFDLMDFKARNRCFRNIFPPLNSLRKGSGKILVQRVSLKSLRTDFGKVPAQRVSALARMFREVSVDFTLGKPPAQTR
jgi:hypothetical protein